MLGACPSDDGVKPVGGSGGSSKPLDSGHEIDCSLVGVVLLLRDEGEQLGLVDIDRIARVVRLRVRASVMSLRASHPCSWATAHAPSVSPSNINTSTSASDGRVWNRCSPPAWFGTPIGELGQPTLRPVHRFIGTTGERQHSGHLEVVVGYSQIVSFDLDQGVGSTDPHRASHHGATDSEVRAPCAIVGRSQGDLDRRNGEDRGPSSLCARRCRWVEVSPSKPAWTR